MLLNLFLAVAVSPPQYVTAGQTVAIECTVNRRTLLSFPEAGAFQITPSGSELLGVKVESLRDGRLSITPPAHPRRTRLAFAGRRGKLIVDIVTTEEAQPQDRRLLWAPAPTAVPARPRPPAAVTATAEPAPTSTPAPSTPAPTPLATDTPSPRPTVAPTVAPAPTDQLELMEMAKEGKPEAIGEVQGLPGQRRAVLEDALRGSRHVWFRFRLDRAAKEGVREVKGPNGSIRAFLAEPAGADLRIIVQLPIGQVNRRAKIELLLENGDAYKFNLSSSFVLKFLKSLNPLKGE